jgi:MerR family transcriptional regulator, heat shock protein HspR
MTDMGDIGNVASRAKASEAGEAGEVASGHAVYSISVASELSGVDPQMLRTYEQRGLLNPFRTDGGTRRYSRDDIGRIADITTLLGDGLNLAGIGQVVTLRENIRRLAAELSELRTASEPNRQEIRRLRRENNELKAELVRRAQPAETQPGGPRTPSSRGSTVP